MVPLGKNYTMNSVEEAAQAVLDVRASFAIPIHYGFYEGTEADAEHFQEVLAGKVQVIIHR
jgi:L-ascorbate metabolism protein UlaG (beta-lactamase superfamily)